MTNQLTLAHLSDPHFASISLHPNQFLSKRWIGNLNLILLRNQFYHITPLSHFPELLESYGVETICITGDFATTSLAIEFEEGAEFVRKFKQPVLALPGNHDCYTREAERKKLYYRYFPNPDLEESRVSLKKIKAGWWWVGLDCAVASPPFCAYGKFFPKMEEKLEETLSQVPKDQIVIISNHFPLYPHGDPKHDLLRGTFLQELLKRWPNVKLYLHGHDHKPYIIDRREQGLPLVFNSGSCARKRGGGFTLFNLTPEEFRYKRFAILKNSGPDFKWGIETEGKFTF